MSTTSPLRRRRRAFSLIETMVAMGVLTVGLLGMASMQVVAVRANQMGGRMAYAAQLARDLSENVQQWEYTDPRLAPLLTVTATDTNDVKDRWDLGRGDAVTVNTKKPQYAEQASDPSASTSTTLGATYTGLSPDMDRDGKPDFRRYWTVYGLDIGGTGTAQGKLVQVVVRWKEPNLGMRQMTLSTFKPNPTAAFQ